MDFLKSGKNFSFLYGGKSLWDFEMSADVKKDGNATVFSYALKDGLCVKNTVKEYPDFDAYEWVTWFENTGSEPSGVVSELWDADIEIPFEHKEPTAVSAFIPDSDEEAASPMVVAILKELGTDVHSGRDGDLVVVSDGKDVFVKHNN